jgi:oligopeptide transport system substrate-binding protein
MKANARTFSLLMLAAGLALVLTWAVVAAQEPEPAPDRTRARMANDDVTLNLNLGYEPSSLDPALAADSASVTTVEQLFIGLVDLDDETAEVRPELATSWIVSPDGTVYTFTLRSDVTWSDDSPVTAEDVRYGILRSLDPATESDYAYLLTFVIKNAADYNDGTITDPNQVGVTAVDSTTLRVTLEHPASYALSILSLWVARPMPQWAIEAHGVPTWTEPANIVTNGPYQLTEWVHDDHILLDKSPTYYDAADVQIDQVMMWMEDEATAWQMYLDGQLDTATVPAGTLSTETVPVGTPLNPILSRELHIQPAACTYYYGFNTSLEPFDDRLVRKAFIAAINRQWLINDALGGFQQPALTFTSSGVFGYVDGYAEGVGIPYDPTQARQWLADAGYPNGQGLPPITLWFNTNPGHQAIAEYVRQNWMDNLGVTVALSDTNWSDYLDLLQTDPPQVWRLGWCLDYRDAHNFVHEVPVVHQRVSLGNWTNSTYESLLDLAAWEQDPDVRKALYRPAEEILVEIEAVMIPLYHYASGVATKPYLERTYWIGSECDIATWRITQ